MVQQNTEPFIYSTKREYILQVKTERKNTGYKLYCQMFGWWGPKAPTVVVFDVGRNRQWSLPGRDAAAAAGDARNGAD